MKLNPKIKSSRIRSSLITVNHNINYDLKHSIVNYKCIFCLFTKASIYGDEPTRTNPGHFAREGIQDQRRCGQQSACHAGICFDGGICKETTRKPHTYHHKYCQTPQQGHSGILVSTDS